MMELNDKQAAVVETPIDRRAKVVAGAGTGKTSVLVERYLRFLRDGVPPSRLLALTFTLKAADEMRRRIFEAVKAERPELLRDLYAAWIMNFHAFGFRIIRENAPAFGIDPGVAVAAEAEKRGIQRLLKARFLAGRIEGVPEGFGGEIPPPTQLPLLFDVYLGVVKKCRGDMIPIGNLLRAIRDDDAEPYRANVAAITAVYGAFTAEMERQNLIDFNDMIGLAARGLAGNEDLTAFYRLKFDHVLVDEFQDTSAAQFELLELLSGDRYSKVTVVGDEKQSIYRWRDARVENIRDFPGKSLGLKKNYRSRQGILDLAHAFVCRDEVLKKNAIRLVADRTEPDKPIVLFHPDGDRDGQQNDLEAQALAAWVVHVTGGPSLPGVPALVGGDTGDRPVGFGDAVVLLRAVNEHKVVPAIERAFERSGVPYVILGGADAADSRALELLYAYLSLLLPGDRRGELLQVLESAPFAVGHSALVELFGKQGGQPGDRYALLSDERIRRVTDAGARERLDKLRALLDRLDGDRASKNFRDFLAGALEDTPFLLRMFDEEATMRAVEDLLGELWNICDQLDSKRELGLWSFLDHLRSAIDGRSFGKVEQLAVPPGRVRIMTIHQAKGLEFPAVAVAGIKPPQSDRSGFFLSKTKGVYSKRWKEWNRGCEHAEERDYEKDMERQEERCILYVAMTRAKDYLFVSSPYADGSKTLFGDVLESAEEGEYPSVVIRSAPADVHAGTHAESLGAPEPEEVAAVVSEWRATKAMLEEQLTAPCPSAGPVQFVNWTALKSFADCPLQYQYRYVLRAGDVLGWEATGSETPAEEKSDQIDTLHIPAGMTPAEHGIFVHELLRELMTRRNGGVDPPDGWIKEAVDRSGVAAKNRKGVADSACRLIEAFESSGLSAPGDDLRVEEPFQVRLDRSVYHGTFDRVERAADGWTVTDYKIGREKGDYAFQIAFYAWALGRIERRDDVSGRLCYLRETDAVVRSIDVTHERLTTLTEGLEKSLADGDFTASPGDVCRGCPYSISCPHTSR
jgi:DNA helicase-2/ATP-dependent DNA helicase PcrA